MKTTNELLTANNDRIRNAPEGSFYSYCRVRPWGLQERTCLICSTKFKTREEHRICSQCKNGRKEL